MNIHWVKAYYVDNENSSVEVVQRDGQLNEYVEYYIDALRNTHRTSPYLPSSQSTQVLSLVACLANETLSNCDSITLEKYRSEINQRFLEKETEAQEKIARMSKVIKNGCLIHAFVSIDEHNYYLLAKLDWQEFLEKVSMKHSSGIVF